MHTLIVSWLMINLPSIPWQVFQWLLCSSADNDSTIKNILNRSLQFDDLRYRSSIALLCITSEFSLSLRFFHFPSLRAAEHIYHVTKGNFTPSFSSHEVWKGCLKSRRRVVCAVCVRDFKLLRSTTKCLTCLLKAVCFLLMRTSCQVEVVRHTCRIHCSSLTNQMTIM